MAVFIFGPFCGLDSGFLCHSPSRVVVLFSKSVQSAPACHMAGRRRISPTLLGDIVGSWTGLVCTCIVCQLSRLLRLADCVLSLLLPLIFPSPTALFSVTFHLCLALVCAVFAATRVTIGRYFHPVSLMSLQSHPSTNFG